jgi:D-sedoheptulose 7-phosphate isomerase
MTFSECLKQSLQYSIAAKQALMNDEYQIMAFDAMVHMVVQAYKNGGRLYIAGNGGSAADAQHLAAEFVSKLAKDRAPLAAEALTVDSSILTAIGNDYGYDQLFARQIAGKMRAEDVFLGISTSGHSPNILVALETCRKMGLRSIMFLGHDGGQAAELADHCVIVPGDRTSVIQELHIVLAHCLCACVESELFA